jgi:putative pyruvate formate lyase activating enzyme
MPGMLDETEAILGWIAHELGPNTYVNLMEQYRPDNQVDGDRYPEINRTLSRREHEEAIAMAKRVGLRRIDRRAAVAGLLPTAG